jgi:hypothetical protein
MSENDHILTQEWLAEKLEAEKIAVEKEAQARNDEQTRESLRRAWKQETGTEPSESELKQALLEKRRADVAERDRLNEAIARRQIAQQF